jgi:hypothetical protein
MPAGGHFCFCGKERDLLARGGSIAEGFFLRLAHDGSKVMPLADGFTRSLAKAIDIATFRA